MVQMFEWHQIFFVTKQFILILHQVMIVDCHLVKKVYPLADFLCWMKYTKEWMLEIWLTDLPQTNPTLFRKHSTSDNYLVNSQSNLPQVNVTLS